MTLASSSDKGCQLTCEEVLNICEQTSLRKQNRGFFHSWKTSSRMGFVSGNEAFVAGALRVAGVWESNLLKVRP